MWKKGKRRTCGNESMWNGGTRDAKTRKVGTTTWISLSHHEIGHIHM